MKNRQSSLTSYFLLLTSFRGLLFLIILVSFLLRLYKINTPLADWHSFRQADTASVTREYVKHGIDLLRPRYHDLSNVQSGYRALLLTGKLQDNVMGWRMVEFPIVNGVIAALLRIFPAFDIVVTSRLFSAVASLVSLVMIVMIGTRLFSKSVGLVAGLAFGITPYSIYYSRAILPEPFLVMFALIALYLFLLYQLSVSKRESRTKQALPGFWVTVPTIREFFTSLGFALFFTLALLIKPMAIFFVPAFITIAWNYRRWNIFHDIFIIILAGSTLIPLYLWRQWIENFPMGIPWSDWLYNQNKIRLRPAWWRWLFYERLTKKIGGFTGIIFFVAGIISRFNFKKFFITPMIVVYGWGAGMFIYLVVFATGNVQHDYYQVIILPWVCIVLALGIVWIWESKVLLIRLFVIFGAGIGLFLGWKQIEGYYNINHWEIVRAGKEVDRLLPKDAKIIAPYMGDTAFLFQTNRTGWTVQYDIDTKIAEGAQYYVSVNFDDEANELIKKYTVLVQNKDFVIIDLTKKKI